MFANLEKDAAELTIGTALLLVIMGLTFWFGTMHGVTKQKLSYSLNMQTLQAKLTKLTQEKQALQDKTAAQAQALIASNKGRYDAIQTSSKQKKKLAKADHDLQVANKKIGLLHVHAVDFDTVIGVYNYAVSSCHGLPASDSTYLVPITVQSSPTQSISEAIKRLAGRYCTVAVNYNSLDKNYKSAIKVSQ